MNLKMTELFLDELQHEAKGTRKALERVPEGHYNWRPHPKSMPFGYLASLVATMPGWVEAMILQDELDFAPKEGTNGYKPAELRTAAELVAALDENVEKARAALAGTTDEHLQTTWKLKAGGYLVSEQPRYVNIRNGMFNHWAHHRGQLTVYLRLNEALVPALYGPSADERGF
jgi:uncharacterized damage-inducible protein DinB